MPNDEPRPWRVATLEHDYYGEQSPYYYRFKKRRHGEDFYANASGRTVGLYLDRADGGPVEVLEGEPAAVVGEAFDRWGRPLEAHEILALAAALGMDLAETRRARGVDSRVVIAPTPAARGGRPKRLSAAQERAVLKRVRGGESIVAVAAAFGVHQNTIRRRLAAAAATP